MHKKGAATPLFHALTELQDVADVVLGWTCAAFYSQNMNERSSSGMLFMRQ
jgi:hypothetical protein